MMTHQYAEAGMADARANPLGSALHMTSRRLRGQYAPPPGGRTYTYEVTWEPLGQQVYWDAKVRLNNELHSMPSGCLELPPGVELAEALTREVQGAIDRSLASD